jgi:hypothetical protein
MARRFVVPTLEGTPHWVTVTPGWRSGPAGRGANREGGRFLRDAHSHLTFHTEIHRRALWTSSSTDGNGRGAITCIG